MIPLAYGSSHPVPAVYIVNTSDTIPSGITTDIGQQFVLVWGIENRGNVPLENVVTSSIIDEGVTFISSNNSNCTYDDSIRKLECVVQGTYISIGTISPIYDHIFVVDSDAPIVWGNTSTVCGTYLDTEYCASDRTFQTINLDSIPEPIEDPVPLIQDVNMTALGELINHLETEVDELETRILDIELRPDPEPIDFTLLESRVGIIEQWIITFQTAWKNVFG